MARQRPASRRKLIYLALVLILVLLGGLYLRSHAVKSAGPSKPVATGGKSKVHRPHHSALYRYVQGILPYLDPSTRVFDRAAGAASRARIGAMGRVCGSYAAHINVLASHLDGVPHPYPWYSPVGRLHHQIMGSYHRMQGAIIECQTASSNGDTSAAPQAVADMASAARALHRQDAAAHAVLAHGH